MAWLGEELEPAGDGDLAPRCVKDAIEEGLFARQRDLFTELSVVFMDTTTLSFRRRGWEEPGGARPFQGSPPRPASDGAGRGPPWRGPSGVHRDACGEHGRHDGAPARGRPSAQALRDRRGLRCGGPGDDLGGDDRGRTCSGGRRCSCTRARSRHSRMQPANAAASPPSDEIDPPAKSAVTFLRLTAGRSNGRGVSSLRAAWLLRCLGGNALGNEFLPESYDLRHARHHLT